MKTHWISEKSLFPVSLLQLSVRFPPKSFSWYMMSNTHAHTHTHTSFDQPLDNMTAPMLFVSPILFHIFAPECCYHLKILPYMLSLFGLNEVEFMLFTNFRLWFTNQAFPNFCQSPPTPAKIPFGLTYCWWKKSGEPVEVGSWNPIIYREFYIPGVSLGISEPSTVCKEALSTTHDRCHLPNVRQSFVLRSRNSTRDVVNSSAGHDAPSVSLAWKVDRWMLWKARSWLQPGSKIFEIKYWKT